MIDPSHVIGDCARLFVEVRRLLGDAWLIEAQTLSFEVTERGDVVLHTGKGISFVIGVEESAGRVLAMDRSGSPAQLSLVEEDGSFSDIGPVELEDD